MVVGPTSVARPAWYRMSISVTAVTVCLVMYVAALGVLGAFGTLFLIALLGVFDSTGADIAAADPSMSVWLQVSIELAHRTPPSVVVPGLLGCAAVLVPGLAGMSAARLRSRLLALPLAALLGGGGALVGILTGFSTGYLVAQF